VVAVGDGVVAVGDGVVAVGDGVVAVGVGVGAGSGSRSIVIRPRLWSWLLMTERFENVRGW
jgi:hypothetical protein